MVRRLDEKDEPGHVAIPLLEGRGAELRLCVAESRDRLDSDCGFGTGQERVEGTEVTGDVEGCLEPPAPSVTNSCSQAAKEVELGGIPETTADWVEARVESQADRCTVTGKIGDRKRGRTAEFNPADCRMRSVNRSSHVGLAQTAG